MSLEVKLEVASARSLVRVSKEISAKPKHVAFEKVYLMCTR